MKVLIIYFSRAGENYAVGNIKKGNTKVIAEKIKELTSGDLFECIPVKEYSSNYKMCCKEALEYQKRNSRPELKSYLTDIKNYDVIYIGGPIYYGEYPYEIYSELDKLDFNNKIVKPFSTHEGSQLGNVEEVLKEKCHGAIIKKGLAIVGSKVNDSQTDEKLKNWIKE